MVRRHERAIRASGKFPGKVDLKEYNTTDKSIVEEWGISDGLFIDGREVRTGPAPSCEKLIKKISKKVRRIK
jgi:hypothetical protein